MKWFVFWLGAGLTGCTGEPGDTDKAADKTDDTDVVIDTGDTGNTGDTGVVFVGTDDDNDGWTVENGDCNDDSVAINPGVTEVVDDDVDNDCDGRIDEVFAGISVFDVTNDAPMARAHIWDFDTLGFGVADRELAHDLTPTRVVADGDAWVVWDSEDLLLARVSAAGAVTVIADLSGEWSDEHRPDLQGLAADLDGSWLIGGYDRLLRITDDGGYTGIASWNYSPDIGDIVVATSDLVVDPTTGVVHLFGFVGGYATWSAEDGFASVVPGRLQSRTHQFFSVTAADGGGVWALGLDEEVGRGIFAYDGVDGFDRVAEWDDAEGLPARVAVESESGDWYVTANRGAFQTVWRLDANGGAAQLHSTAGVVTNRIYTGIVIRWIEDASP